MSRNLKAFSSVQRILHRSAHRKNLLPISTWGFQNLNRRYYSTGDDRKNTAGSFFNKYTFGLLTALGVIIGGYQFYVKDEEVKSPDTGKKKFKRPSKVFKYPKESSLIPDHVPYLLIGGGTASFSAFRAIKSADPTAKVLVVGNESFNPYMRPPLSKEMFYNDNRDLAKSLRFKQWNASERSLFYEPEDFYTPVEKLVPPPPSETPEDKNKPEEEKNNPGDEEKAKTNSKIQNHGGIAVVRGWQVTELDPVKKVAILEDGKAIRFDKCLLATGASPKNLPVFQNNPQAGQMSDRLTLYRNVMDFQELESVLENGAKTVAVIGGGFLGSELACALAKRGAASNTQVYQIFREKGNMARVLPEYLSAWTTRKVEEEGVHTKRGVTVEEASLLPSGEGVQLTLSDGSKLSADHVVVAVGVTPNTQLAKGAGLETDPERGGFLVNSELSARSDIYAAGDCACFYDGAGLETDPERGGFLVNSELSARSDIYAAGDCACFYDVMLGRRRVEHHDHAVVSGRLAGENMTGAHKHYYHQSMFWSDLGPEVGYEAIGIVDSRLPTVGVYAKSNEQDTPQAASLASGTSDRSSAAQEESTKTTAVTKVTSSSKPSNDYGKGVIFYLRNDIVVGIVLWNVFNRMSIARQVLKSERKYEDLNEVAKLFNIHAE
ncbi:hypothetical protein M8J75_005703 [Diaphorina citri]|nr:hypothetical protein M8J75_005703 [Diaphorina citri]